MAKQSDIVVVLRPEFVEPFLSRKDGSVPAITHLVTTLKAMHISIQPMHANKHEPSLSAYFIVPCVPVDVDPQSVVEQLRRCEAVDDTG